MLGKTINNLPLSRPYLLITLISVVVFFPTWARLASLWLQFEQVLAHGAVTALIFVGLILIHPPHVAKFSDSGHRWPDLLAGPAFILVTLVWGVLELVRIDTLAFLMLPIGLGVTAWCFLGWRQAARFVPYILLLALSLPIWADLVPYLVKLASLVVGHTVHLFGITILVEGNTISLPYGRLVIADGCSGIRYFAISLLLAMLTSILNDARPKGWIISLAVAALLGLLANWVRIIILVLVAYQSHMTSGLLTDHEMMGWLVFAAFMIPALYFSPVRKRDPQAAADYRVPLKRRGYAYALAAFLLGPVAIGMASSVSGDVAPWTLTGTRLKEDAQDRLPMTLTYPEQFQQTVWSEGDAWISLAQSAKQRADDKLMPYFRSPIDREQWYLEPTSGHDGIQLYRNLYSRDQVAVSQWYQVGQYRADSYRTAKLLQVPATLHGYHRFAVVTAQIACSDRTCESEIQKLKRLMSTLSLSEQTPSGPPSTSMIDP